MITKTNDQIQVREFDRIKDYDTAYAIVAKEEGKLEKRKVLLIGYTEEQEK